MTSLESALRESLRADDGNDAATSGLFDAVKTRRARRLHGQQGAAAVVVAVTAVLIAVSVGGSGARRATSSSSHGGAGSAMAGTQAGAMQVPPVTCPARQPTANVPATRDATFNGSVPGTPVVASVCRYGASAREGYAQLRSSTVVRGRSLAPMVAAFNVALTSGREHGCPAPVYAPPIEVDYFGYAEGLPVQVTLSLGGPSNCRSDPKPVRNADGSIRGWPS